jgi:hypothetical protein
MFADRVHEDNAGKYSDIKDLVTEDRHGAFADP